MPVIVAPSNSRRRPDSASSAGETAARAGDRQHRVSGPECRATRAAAASSTPTTARRKPARRYDVEIVGRTTRPSDASHDTIAASIQSIASQADGPVRHSSIQRARFVRDASVATPAGPGCQRADDVLADQLPHHL